ncbi:MAG: VWA domain-containing protein [Chloroflexi bacterium]|nr:VWA domain-containing protein [Chloroflexota bacterium]
MEDRIVRFIAALRAAGLPVSIAESEDAWHAIEHLGVRERELFRLALRATLVKNAPDLPIFDELFPLFFGLDEPPMANPLGGLTPDQRQMLETALQQLAYNIEQMLRSLMQGGDRRSMYQQLRELSQQPGMPDVRMPHEFRDLMQHLRELQQLLEKLLRGEPFSQQELEQLARDARIEWADSPVQARQMARRMQQMLGWEQLDRLLDALMELLAMMGMDPQSIRRLREQIEQNKQALQQQLEQFAGQAIGEHTAEEMREKRESISELMERPFEYLSQREIELLRDEVRRLAARLRTRVSLRQKRGKIGKLDAKSTIRVNLRYGGVPMELRFKSRRLKPKLVTLLDVSTSMRPVTQFFLWLMYELQDQVQKTRSFAFIDHLEEVSDDLAGARPEEGMRAILAKLPPGHYNTDLGYSLRQFQDKHADALDSRTTFIVLGDARNNFNDPALDVFGDISRRCRRLIWMNPEYPAQWGTGDSDMLAYAALCTEVYQVRNLAQLVEAIDKMLAA